LTLAITSTTLSFRPGRSFDANHSYVEFVAANGVTAVDPAAALAVVTALKGATSTTIYTVRGVRFDVSSDSIAIDGQAFSVGQGAGTAISAAVDG
jgi:hypothetical protein